MLRRNFKRFIILMRNRWIKIWMKFAGVTTFGRFATRMAGYFAPPHKARTSLVRLNKLGYIDPSAILYHPKIQFGKHIFIGERVTVFDRENSGVIKFGDNVRIYRDTIIEAGYGAHIVIGDNVSIHPRCQLNAFIAPIDIKEGVMIAPGCALYSYNHGIHPDTIIRDQPLESKGPIIIDEEAWIGVNAIILSGVRIGKGAVVGAGAVVMQNVPDGAIVGGNPARIIKMRSDLKTEKIIM